MIWREGVGWLAEEWVERELGEVGGEDAGGWCFTGVEKAGVVD